MKVQVSRSITPYAKLFGGSDVIETVDITPYLQNIQKIREIAKFIRESKSCPNDTGLLLAYAIGEIDEHLEKDIERMLRYR